jgi:hypothetical protein
MRCPTCGANIHGDDRACPGCGEPVGERVAGMLKTSTIFISADHTEGVYRSVREVPEPLRKKLLRSTNSVLSRTILIADRRGRWEIERALRNLPGASEQRPWTPVLSGLVPAVRRKVTIARAVGILLTGTAGLLVWLMLSR